MTACPCGTPLGHHGSISVEQVTAWRAVVRCLKCADIDERSVAPVAAIKQAPERRRR